MVRRLAKYLPLSPELVRALEADEEPVDAVAPQLGTGAAGLLGPGDSGAPTMEAKLKNLAHLAEQQVPDAQYDEVDEERKAIEEDK